MSLPTPPLSPPTTFEDALRLVLSPAEQFSSHVNLGKYKNTDGSEFWPRLCFRKLLEHELRQLAQRLQTAPQQHVVVLNLSGHDIGPSGYLVLSQALPHLSALQVLNLGCQLILLFI